ncbi:MAG: FAD-linked oxidase C-terminal domain-containing protein [Acidobacteriota bacterium]|nr:FAD-linked oxidase C-terminal domain-containing protein [Acidobacteriota bacterium]
MNKTVLASLETELNQSIEGDVLFDEMSRHIYSTDASLYQINPLGIVLPKTRNEIHKIVQIANKHGVPLLPRGGGTSLAGQTVLAGLVVDCSKYLTSVLEVNAEERWVRVEPGIVLDNLNEHLKIHNLHFPPDPATSSRANIGGMIGNNSAGVRSIRYGKTVDQALEASVVLSTGEELLLKNLDHESLQQKCSQKDREGELYRNLCQVVKDNSEEIISRFPRVMRRVGGYNLDYLIADDGFNLTKLIVGSEGTLAFVTSVKLNLEPIPRHTAVSVIHFDDLIKAIDAVPVILDYNPSAIEILDHYGLELARSQPAVAPLCAQFIQGDPEAILWVEFSGEIEEETNAQWEAMKACLNDQAGFYTCYDATNEQAKQTVWDVRKHSLGILLGMKGDAKPLPFIEDACIPVEHLSEYISSLLDFCNQYNRPVALYAHASAGVIHIRPILNLKQKEDLDILRKISAKSFEMVCEYGGSWSGEHGDGLVRSYKNREFFGEQLYQAFREVKQIFDPANIMNPGKIIDAQDITENLRIHPDYETNFPTTHFQFRQERGFDRAIELCTGVGHCRKTLSGTMCPSYIATRDEEHSTRGRANALRMAISGKLGPDGLTNQRLYEVLDLCLECKACKSECPSGVDMARLKTEFLAHYYQHHGLPLGKRLIATMRQTAQWASHSPTIFNWVMNHSISQWLMDKLFGIDQRRTLPPIARQTFVAWWGKNFNSTQQNKDQPQVALFVDTFTNFYEPAVGIAAVQLLDRLGYRVVLADVGCCGRPMISSGQLESVKKNAHILTQKLQKYADQQIPIIVLEPSCWATIRDDYPDLLDHESVFQSVEKYIFSLEEFLVQDEVSPRITKKLEGGPTKILFHGHCQQKALMGTNHSINALNYFDQVELQEIDSGCCGMAGSFGYEKKHYDISEQIGEDRLFPAIREAPEQVEVVASGFSCRSQIQHFTGREAKHLAEILAQYLAR